MKNNLYVKIDVKIKNFTYEKKLYVILHTKFFVNNKIYTKLT